MEDLRPTERFSDRVENYVRYRPSYPPEVIALLREQVPAGRVADIGAGTGIFSRLLLEAGYQVVAVEPNDDMRAAAEAELGVREGYSSVAGTAEETTLPDASVDVVTAAQAAHWFRRDEAKAEIRRILTPEGVTMLVWNQRLPEGTPFLRGYEAALRTYAPEYAQVNHREFDACSLAEWFSPDTMFETRFPNAQSFDWDGLAGRVLSSSYAPLPGQPGHAELFGELRRLFDLFAEDGLVTFLYDCQVYWSRIGR